MPLTEGVVLDEISLSKTCDLAHPLALLVDELLFSRRLRWTIACITDHLDCTQRCALPSRQVYPRTEKDLSEVAFANGCAFVVPDIC